MRKVSFASTGNPNEFSRADICENELVVLYQDKRVYIAKYHHPETIDDYPSMTNANKNSSEFEKELLNLISKSFPDDIESNDAIIYTLPLKFEKN